MCPSCDGPDFFQSAEDQELYWAMSGRRTDIFQPIKEPPHPPEGEVTGNPSSIDYGADDTEINSPDATPQENLEAATSANPVTPTPTAVNPEKPPEGKGPTRQESSNAPESESTSPAEREPHVTPSPGENSAKPSSNPDTPHPGPSGETGPLCRLCGTRKNRNTRLCRYCDVPRYLEDSEAQDLYMLMSGKKIQLRTKPGQPQKGWRRGVAKRTKRQLTGDDYLRRIDREVADANLLALTIKVVAISLVGALLVIGLWNYSRIIDFLEVTADKLLSGASASSEPAGDPISLMEAREGDCLNKGSDENAFATVYRVDCDDEHELEVFYRGWALSDDPERDEYVNAFRICNSAFAMYVGIAYDASSLFYFAEAPSWQDDRTLLCILHEDGFRKVQGTAKGSVR
jgi:hypothetical protein